MASARPQLRLGSIIWLEYLYLSWIKILLSVKLMSFTLIKDEFQLQCYSCILSTFFVILWRFQIDSRGQSCNLYVVIYTHNASFEILLIASLNCIIKALEGIIKGNIMDIDLLRY